MTAGIWSPLILHENIGKHSWVPMIISFEGIVIIILFQGRYSKISCRY